MHVGGFVAVVSISASHGVPGCRGLSPSAALSCTDHADICSNKTAAPPERQAPRLVINQTSTPAIIAGPLAASRCRFPSRPRSPAHRRAHEVHGRLERQKCISLSGISKLLKSASGIQTDCARDMASSASFHVGRVSRRNRPLSCTLLPAEVLVFPEYSGTKRIWPSDVQDPVGQLPLALW